VTAVHRTYAQALFDAAIDEGRLDRVHEELGDFAAAVASVPELRAVLRNPLVDPGTKSGILDDLVADGDVLVRNFLRLAADKGRVGEIEEIAREFDRLVAREERRLDVDLTTAFELSEDQAEQIVRQIELASGRKVDATRTVDPSLIGGLVLQAGTLRVDASVRGRLERLRRELVSSR
jgi:F-type H+-transporting ATPase subunit delta